MVAGSHSLKQARRARLLALLIGVPLIIGGLLQTVRDSNARRRADLNSTLSADAAFKASQLREYFARAHDLLVVTGQNPALRDYFKLSGDRQQRVAQGGEVLGNIDDAIRYLHNLYPDSIEEICFIDSTGAEIARRVGSTGATGQELSLDERNNTFFDKTMALAPGDVYQAAPYVSPDSAQWAISNSTKVTGPSGEGTALLHFEVSIESFRRTLASTTSKVFTRVIDARTGLVIIDTRFPQLGTGTLGRPDDRTFSAVAPNRRPIGTLSADGNQIAYARVKPAQHNDNDWIVAVSAPAAATSWRDGLSKTTLLSFFAASLLIGSSVMTARSYRKRLEAAALTDSLTGLANRVLFEERASQALAFAARSADAVGIMLLDLDRFKEINDTLGHHAGDELLKAIGPRVEAVLRRSDTLARLGGDEFAILLPGIASAAAAGKIADRVIESLAEPFQIEGLDIAIDVSIGVVVSPENGDNVELLLQRADLAMYAAKQGRLGAMAFHDGLAVYKPEHLSLFGELRHAIDTRQLVLHYQPKIDLADGRVVGVEALVRWIRPDGTTVPPMDFIPLAERTSLIVPLTGFVLDEALAQCRRWLDTGQEMRVAVNITTRNLLDRSFPDLIGRALRRWGVPAHLLELEITESTIMADPVCAKVVLDQLHELGVMASIDDFGTGYSSLAHLRELPIDTIKIDRSFITRLRDDADSVIVRSLIDLGRSLGLRIVAEGVEDEHTARLLTELGCSEGQGYLWSRPVPADEVVMLFDALAGSS
jgi:diguanylate cyclase (GGDEF)-like protein